MLQDSPLICCLEIFSEFVKLHFIYLSIEPFHPPLAASRKVAAKP